MIYSSSYPSNIEGSRRIKTLGIPVLEMIKVGPMHNPESPIPIPNSTEPTQSLVSLTGEESQEGKPTDPTVQTHERAGSVLEARGRSVDFRRQSPPRWQTGGTDTRPQGRPE